MPSSAGWSTSWYRPTSSGDQPSLRLQEEDDVAAGGGRLVAPVGDQRVEDEVALGALRLDRRRRRRAGRRGPRGCRGRGCRCRRRRRTWRRRRRCGRRRGPGCRRRWCCARPRRRRRRSGRRPRQASRSTIGISSGFTFTDRSAGGDLVVGPAGEVAVDGAVEVRDVALGPLRQAHVLEALRVQAPLLARQVREVLRGDRRPAWVVVGPHLRGGWGRGDSSPSGYRVIDQISISVSSGPRGRNR